MILFLLIGVAFFLGFYWGHYYGQGVWRFCRYWKLKAYRKFVLKRRRFNSNIVLGS